MPGARDHREFYANLRDRVDSVREVPADRWDPAEFYDPDRAVPNKSISKWCGIVDEPYAFDHDFFGISPREAKLLDPLQRLLMEVTHSCIEDAGTTAAALGELRTAVYVGNMERDHMAELTSPGHDVESHSVLGVYDCLLANRLSQAFGFSGASTSVDAACASALVAVHLGVQALVTGEADAVLAGGVNLNLHPWKYVGFSKARMLSPTGRCQTFDRDADGFVPGDGVGMVLLRRLDDALADGDHVYGVIRGTAVNHGRRRSTITAPTVASQREVVSAALAQAGVSPRDVTFVETHGTGTALGDPIEVEALRQVFGPASTDSGWCALGAVKTNIGHLEGAAGIAGLIKVLMMMAERRIVPNLHLRNLNPLIDLDGGPFRLASDNADWDPAAPGRPLLAGVSSFGFGGVNAHLVVEEFRAPERAPAPARPRPFLLSAASEEALRRLSVRWREGGWLDTPLADAATTLAVGRAHLPHRLGGVVTGAADVAALLEAAQAEEPVTRRWALRTGLLDVPGRDVLDTLATWEVFRELADDPAAASLREGGRGPAERCVYTALVASALLRLGLRPELVVGHGAGLWPALAVAGVLDLATAAALARGQHPAGAPGTPELPVAVPGSDRVVTPFAVDRHYLDGLRAASAPGGDELRPLLDLVGRLGGQRTFQANLRDWQLALADRDDELVLDPGAVRAPLVTALAAQNALDRLNRKWDLPLNRFVRDERTVELLDLVLDGVLEPREVLALVLDDPGASERVAASVAGRPDRPDLTDPARYPALRRSGALPADLASFEAWAAAARSTADTPVASGLSVVAVGGPAATTQVAEVTVPDGAEESLTESLVELWKRGVDVRWDRHPVGSEGTKVSLPTTEFVRTEHRVPPVAPVAPPSSPEPEDPPGAGIVELRARWERTRRAPAPETGGPVLVVVPSGATEVARAARRLPGSPRVVELGGRTRTDGGDSWVVEPDDTEAWHRVLDAVSRDDGGTRSVVLAVDGDVSVLAVVAVQLAKAAYGRHVRILAVGGQVGGTAAAELAALTGLARTLARETDTVRLRAVAVPGSLTEASTWDVVADELGRIDGTELVCHRDGVRTARRWVAAEPVPAEPGRQAVRPGGTYLVTGGTGGLGRLVTAHLLAVPGVRVALVGRSPDGGGHPSERVAYFRADVADAAQVVDVLARVRERFGPLTGVLHAAGVLRDGHLVHKSADDVRAVLAPKVLGAVNLDRATRDEPLEVFALFSSMVGAVGNPGQADYAMANAFLDQFAEIRETLRAAGERSGRSVSIGWPVWRDGGMTVTDRGVLGEHTGVLPMPTATGLAALDRLLSTGGGARPFVYGVPDRVAALLDPEPAAPESPVEVETPDTAPVSAPGDGAPSGERVSEWARDYVATLIGELRGVPAEEIDLDLGLDRIGLDSIVISEFNAKVEAQLGAVGETLLFESRTLAAAAERIAERRPAELAARYGTPAPTGVELRTEAVPTPPPTARHEDEPDDGDVAVIGLAGRYPMAPDLDTFWRNLAAGRDCVTTVPPTRWDPDTADAYCRSGAFLDGVDEFDPLFFGISPREAEVMDPQERLFLQTAWHTFEDAGYPPRRLGDPAVPGARSVGVFVGVTTQTYLLWGPEQQRAGHAVVPPSPQWSIANRVSYWLDLRGPSMPVDTACAASLTAVHLAARSMAAGECAMALVGGVNLYLHPAKYDWLCSLQMLSRTGRCHTFGADADGFVPGEGVGAALLKPLRAALADGDRVLGVIKGTAVNHGGRTTGFTVPSPVAQGHLVETALADAGVDPGTVGYVEAHGTGTALGDPIEITGLGRAYAGVAEGSCAIGSVKTNIGHLESASGMAGLTKVLLQFRHGKLVPSLHSDEPNPRIDFAATPFTVQRTLADWPRRHRDGVELPRRAGISSFGAGGANAHVVVEEAPRVPRERGPEGGEHLVVVSANDTERLRVHCANLAAAIRERAGELRLSEVAYQLQVRREPLAQRLALLADDPVVLADRLAAFAEERPITGPHWTTTHDRDARDAARAALPHAVAVRDWAAIAAAWVAGLDVPWESLHDVVPPHVSLPTYPFARERYWLPELPGAASGEGRHPFGLRRSPGGARVEFTGREPVLAQHRVDGVPIFPAAGCLELMREAAGHRIEPGGMVRLRNTVWSAPILVSEPRTLWVSHTGTDVEVRGTGADGELLTHVTGRIETGPAPELDRLDVDALRNRCTDTVEGSELYREVRGRGLDLGTLYQAVERLHWNADEAVSELRLPVADDADRYVLHPGVLDAAFQASLWLLGRRSDRLHLPFSMGGVEILGPTPSRGFAHVVLRTVTDTGSKLEVRLADESGRVVLRVVDFWVRPWQAPRDPATGTETVRTPPDGGSFFRPEWVDAERTEHRAPGSVLVLASAEEEGAALAEGFAEHADRTVVAVPGAAFAEHTPDHYVIRPEIGADAGRLLAHAGPVDTVVFAWPRQPGPDVAARLDDGLLPLFHLVHALLTDSDKRPVRLVCAIPAGVPEYQALGGFLRTVSLESTRISFVLVEGATPAQLTAETLGAAAGSEVRHTGGRRTVRRWRRFRPAPGDTPALRRGGVYLVTGGAGGLGALVAEWLARTAGARVVLAGRSPEDTRVRAILDRVRAAGGEARYVVADVSTRDGAVAAVGVADDEFGALHGIVHCAGVLRDDYLVRQSPEKLREVVAGKVLGATHLDGATAGRTLDFLCLFSSLASALGSAGQAGYAYANAVLDAYAAVRPGRTVSVDWPLWADGGMGVDAEVAEWLRVNLGLRPLGTETGLAALGAVLGGPDRQVVFVPGDGDAVARQLGVDPHADSGVVSGAVTAGSEVSEAAATSETSGGVAPGVRDLLVAEIAGIVKLDPARVEPHRALGDYGFDSLAFGRLANRLVERLGVDITPALFFEYTTVEAVVEHLTTTYPTELAAHHAQAAPEPERVARPVPAVTTVPVSAPVPVPDAPAPARPTGPEPIAVIGMHGMLPGSSDLAEYWRNLDAGRDLVTEIPQDRWDWREWYHTTAGPGRTNSKWGGFLPEVDRFDARFFGISPREAELMDPQQRLFLQTAYKAVEEAGYRPSDLARGTTGLFVGVGSHDYYDLLRDAGVPVEAFTTTGMFHAILANRVSYLLNLSGPSFPVDTACSSSLVALRSAVESLRAGSCDTAIVGGVNLLLSPTVYISFSRAGMLSPTGRCRTFDASADGYVRAEGVGALLLKPLSAAERDGDHVHAVIRGSAVNHGGKVNTLTTPNPTAQADVIVRAFEEGGVDPETVGYLELHGTGTALGDPIEINGVKRAFGELRDRAGLPRLTEPTTLIGSVKTNIGHAESAAGLAGIFKVILAMKHGRIPGTLHLDQLNPQIRLADSPLSIVDQATRWPRRRADDGTELPRRAGVSSFGFGGVNGHVVLEEYRADPPSPGTGEQVFVLSARDTDRLREYAAALADAVRPRPEAGERASGTASASGLTEAVADLLGVTPADVAVDEPLTDLGVSGPYARLLSDRLADAGWPVLDPAVLAAGTIAKLAATNGPESAADASPSPAGELADIAYTLQVGREPMSHRLAVVTDSAVTLADELRAFADGGTPGPRTSVGVSGDDRGAETVAGGPRELARRWVSGGTVDWTALHTGRRPRRVSLPTYPFARDRYWVPRPPSGERQPGPAPAVADVVRTGMPDGDGEVVFRTRLSAGDPLVDQHRVHGERVLAGVVQLDLAAAALARHRTGTHRLTRLSWTSPLVVPSSGREILVRLVDTDGGVTHRVETCDDGEVVTHSTGRWERIDGEPAGMSPIDVEAVRRRCPTEVDEAAIYATFERIDIRYGPLFRGLRTAWVGDGELLARVTTDAESAPDATLHPTVLDAALQAITVLEGCEPGRTRLPFSVEAVELRGSVPLRGYVHVRALPGGGHDVVVLDEGGAPRVVLREVTVRSEPDPLAGFFHRPEWAEQPAPVTAPPRGGFLIVHPAQAYGIDRALAARADGPVWRIELGTRNRATGERTWEVDVADPDFTGCLTRMADVRHVWFLGGLSTAGGESVRPGAPLLFRLVRALADTDLVQRIETLRSVTGGAQDAGGRRITNPAGAALIGFTKSLAREYGHLGVSCVDLGDEPIDPEWAADALLAEPARQDNREVALAGGRRLVRRLRPVALPPPTRPPFRDGGCYLVVGGTGGIGLALAEHLASTVSARLVLVGRSPLGARIEAALENLVRLGGRATYEQADITDADALRAVIAKARTQGPLHGVVHAAMVLHDGIVERLTEERFDAVLAPKADGTRVLGEVLASEPLDFLLVASSVQSFTGAAGQANYAAASTAQDAFAHHLAAQARYPVYVVNWGPWASVGRVAHDSYRDSLTSRGYRPIPTSLGMAAIERVLASDERQLVALHADTPVLDSIGVTGEPAVTGTTAVVAHRADAAEQEALDAFVRAALWHAVDRLGLVGTSGRTRPRTEFTERFGALPKYRRLVEALVRILLDAGFLVEEADGVTVAGTAPRPEAPDPEPLRRRFPGLAARLDLVDRCLAALPDVLTGARPGTEVLFPRGSMELVTAIYRGEALVDYCNAVVAEQVVAAAPRTGRPVRVLELGAGTGSTSEVVLAALRGAGVTVEYDFTDVARGLVRQAEARLDRSGADVRFRELDVERPVEAQGFAAGHYDVVLAGNVLHAVRDLDAALGEVRRLLAPEGRLVFTEVTAVQPFHTVTFGLLDGWWHFTDEHRRLPGSPLLDEHLWRHRLEATGFTGVTVLGRAAGPGSLPQRVFTAGVAGDPRPSTPSAPSALSSERPGTSPAEAARPEPEVPAAPARRGSLDEAVRSLVAERVAECLGLAVEQIDPDVSLPSLGVDSIVAVELANRLSDAIGVVLKTVVVFDHPTVGALSAHLVERHGAELAARLAPAPAPAPATVPEPPAPAARGDFRAVRFERPGGPGDLRIVPIEPVAPAAGEVEVLVKAFPINFSDFLLARGLYPLMPDFPFTPGVEVSGVVRRVGPGVRSVRPGDEVIALTRPEMGGQASVVVTDENFVVAKPVGVSHEEACGFAVPFLAMYLAFERAAVRPGERVLIPAATGTNGLVAVQLAKLAGAEVIATASAPHKIAYLEGLGVPDAIDHQRANVVEEVLRRTGGTGVDVVINSLGGEATQQGLDVLAPGGRYVETAVFGLQSSTGLDLSRLVDNQSFHSLNTKKYFLRHPERRAEYLRLAVEHLASGRVRPTVAHVLPFDRVTEAYALKEDRGLIGRVVVRVPDPEGTGGEHTDPEVTVAQRLLDTVAREFGVPRERLSPDDPALRGLVRHISTARGTGEVGAT
ncbi:methyltransferase family protein [Saccharomonospora cyanea NA-134]|uniref:Methyltransferase family protein n=2 Tax=Saccharomonospora cyanea TaxID=40989 RepID=H5XCT5_9PSEU|nr:methyltransferase family protein [Saccharomonospora cyanea NA-134]